MALSEVLSALMRPSRRAAQRPAAVRTGDTQLRLPDSRRRRDILLASLEWAVPAWRGPLVLLTIWIYRHSGVAANVTLLLLLVVNASHLLSALRPTRAAPIPPPITGGADLTSDRLRRGVLLRWGTPGLVADFVHSLVAISVVGLAFPQREYLAVRWSLPLAGYGAPLLAVWIVRFFFLDTPAGNRRRGLLASILSLAIIGLLILLFTGLILRNGYSFHEVPWGTVLTQAAWSAFAIPVGAATLALARRLSTVETSAFRDAARAVHDKARTIARGAIKQLDARDPDLDMVRLQLKLIVRAAAAIELQLELRSTDHQDLASIMNLALEPHRLNFRNGITVSRLGGLIVPGYAASLMVRVLDELLLNAAQYGAGSARVQVSLTPGWLDLTVSDDGPGFDESLIAPGTSLFRLATDLQRQGAGLEKLPGPATVLRTRIAMNIKEGHTWQPL